MRFSSDLPICWTCAPRKHRRISTLKLVVTARWTLTLPSPYVINNGVIQQTYDNNIRSMR